MAFHLAVAEPISFAWFDGTATAKGRGVRKFSVPTAAHPPRARVESKVVSMVVLGTRGHAAVTARR
jgi:hypothetical protein